MDNYIVEITQGKLQTAVSLMKKYKKDGTFTPSIIDAWRERAIAYWDLLSDIDGVMDNTAYHQGLAFLQNF